jgi:hypothetical protein
MVQSRPLAEAYHSSAASANRNKWDGINEKKDVVNRMVQCFNMGFDCDGGGMFR